MKNFVVLLTVVLFLAADSAAQGVGAGTGKTDQAIVRNPSGDKKLIENLEKNLNEFFGAVIRQKTVTVVKYINPDYLDELQSPANGREMIDLEFKASREENLIFTDIRLNPEAKNLLTAASPQKIKVKVEFKTEDGIAEFDGAVTAVLIEGKWYFIHQKTMLESFGIKEFEKEIAENSNNEASGATMKNQTIESQAISIPAPEYPKAASSVKADGIVEVEIVINKEGNVISAQAVSGHPLLRDAAVRAAYAAKFKPFISNGKAAIVTATLSYNFTP